MLTAQRTEREYHDACADRADTERRAALACNAILTLTQAQVLRLAMDAMPHATAMLAETVFEAYGWPADDVDESWLNDEGRVTWSAFRTYRGFRGSVA